jgi:undecaprenyl-diphosphatase
MWHGLKHAAYFHKNREEITVSLSWKHLVEIDVRWSEKCRIPERLRKLRSVAAFFAHSCDSWFWLLGLSFVWLIGASSWKRWSIKLSATIIVLATLVILLKFTIRRRRPEGEWGAIYRRTDPHSFPSGHAARAILLAILITAWGPTWLGMLLILWAPLVSVARVGLGIHYLSDVLAGTLLGGLVAFLALLLT